jgi:hypothetical protein
MEMHLSNDHLYIYGMGYAPAFMIKGDAPAFVMGDRMGDAPAFMIKGDVPLETRVSFTCIIEATQ